MTEEKENYLREKGNLFQEPDSTLLLSSGCGRHWPDARGESFLRYKLYQMHESLNLKILQGIFHNKDENVFVWINEEDHSRLISMEKGDDVKGIVSRFARLTEALQGILLIQNQLSISVSVVLKEEGRDFMHSEHLGWILTCPSNLGTGLRAGSMVKIPLFSARKDFKDVCGKMGLQVRGTKGNGPIIELRF